MFTVLEAVHTLLWEDLPFIYLAARYPMSSHMSNHMMSSVYKRMDQEEGDNMDKVGSRGDKVAAGRAAMTLLPHVLCKDPLSVLVSYSLRVCKPYFLLPHHA